MSIDSELATWQKEWREPAAEQRVDQSELLPDLMKKIRRQDRRSAIAVGLTCVCVILGSVAAWRVRTSFLSGLATGLWFASLTMGTYAWWVRRGTWKPAARTTAAYVRLAYNRAVAKERLLKFAFRFILVTTILYAGLMVWTWRHFSMNSAGVLAAMATEIVLFDRLMRKQRRAIEVSRKLLESVGEGAELEFEGRQV